MWKSTNISAVFTQIIDIFAHKTVVRSSRDAHMHTSCNCRCARTPYIYTFGVCHCCDRAIHHSHFIIVLSNNKTQNAKVLQKENKRKSELTVAASNKQNDPLLVVIRRFSHKPSTRLIGQRRRPPQDASVADNAATTRTSWATAAACSFLPIRRRREHKHSWQQPKNTNKIGFVATSAPSTNNTFGILSVVIGGFTWLCGLACVSCSSTSRALVSNSHRHDHNNNDHDNHNGSQVFASRRAPTTNDHICKIGSADHSRHSNSAFYKQKEATSCKRSCTQLCRFVVDLAIVSKRGWRRRGARRWTCRAETNEQSSECLRRSRLHVNNDNYNDDNHRRFDIHLASLHWEIDQLSFSTVDYLYNKNNNNNNLLETLCNC